MNIKKRTPLIIKLIPVIITLIIINIIIININHIKYIKNSNKKINNTCFKELKNLSKFYPILCDETSNIYNLISKTQNNKKPEMFLFEKDSIYLITYSYALNYLEENKKKSIILSTIKMDLFNWTPNMFLVPEYLFLNNNDNLKNNILELINYLIKNNSKILRFLIKKLDLNIKLEKYSKLTTISYLNNSLSFIPIITFGEIKDIFVENLLINLKIFIKNSFKKFNNNNFSMEFFIDGILNIFIKSGLIKISKEEVFKEKETDYIFIYSLFPNLKKLNVYFPEILKFNFNFIGSLGFDFSNLLINNNNLINKYFDKNKLNRLLKYTNKFLMCNLFN